MVWDMVKEVEPEQQLLSQAARRAGGAGAQSAAAGHHPQFSTMDRRHFVTTLAAGVVPVRAEAQAPGKVARVGFLSSARRPADAELQKSPWHFEMQRLGWVEGRNLAVERRFTDGNMDQLATFARELVEARVDVIVALSERDAAEERHLSSTLPIVLI
jgi:putative ABC transport system substrate-binding protein